MSKFVLSYKMPHIVKTEQTKNRTHQTYRWKQYAFSKSREALEEVIAVLSEHERENWKIEEHGVRGGPA